MDEILIRDYTAADGMEMLAKLEQGIEEFPEAESWCKESVRDGMAFAVIYEGELVACAGIIKEKAGVGVAWALYPLDIGKHHIDPRIARDRLNGLMDTYGLWRVWATVRVDFPAGASYLAWLGFKREGRMLKNEPDKTDSYLYAIVR